MPYLNLLLVALTAFSTKVTAAAIPTQAPKAQDDCNNTTQYLEVKRNQSTVFGLQLSGAALSDDGLDEICSNIDGEGYGKWGQEGLSLDLVGKAVCNATDSQPDAETALPNIVPAQTNVFTTLLLNAFGPPNDTTYSYLCSNLRFKSLNSFLLDDTAIVNATCTATTSPDSTLSPEPFTPLTSINQTAINAYQNAASQLYAYQYASAATSPAQLSQWCARAPDQIVKWEKLQFNGSLVQETLCGVKDVLSVQDAKTAITKWTGKMFSIVLENGSNVDGYKEWLCGTLKCESMNAVGLDGDAVWNDICAS